MVRSFAGVFVLHSNQVSRLPKLMSQGVDQTMEAAWNFIENTKGGVSAAPDVLAGTITTSVNRILDDDIPGFLAITFDSVVLSICKNLFNLGNDIEGGKHLFNQTLGLVKGIQAREISLTSYKALIREQFNALKTVEIQGKNYTVTSLPSKEIEDVLETEIPEIDAVSDLESYNTQLNSIPDIMKISKDVNSTYFETKRTISNMTQDKLSGVTANPKKDLSDKVATLNESLSSAQSEIKNLKSKVLSQLNSAEVTHYDGYR
jgi:hypothetical protein